MTDEERMRLMTDEERLMMAESNRSLIHLAEIVSVLCFEIGDVAKAHSAVAISEILQARRKAVMAQNTAPARASLYVV